MRRIVAVTAVLVCISWLSFGQSSGTGYSSNVTSQSPVIQAGDSSLVTQRIMSSTRYKVTPGDQYRLSITMDEIYVYSLTLQENYDIEVPYLGTVNVKGKLFSELRKTIHDGLKKALPLAQYIDVTLESAARFDVTVYGGVQAPGIITVMPLSRVSDAVSLAGKIKSGASNRQIALIRGDTTITVDLLRYSNTAESDDNPYLEPGDKIFVPQAIVTVSISGEVKYPGAYEIVPGESLATLIGYAGGVTPGARLDGIEISQFPMDKNHDATSAPAEGQMPQSPDQGLGKGAKIKVVNLATEGSTALSDGDRIRVPAMMENRAMILVTGALYGSPVSSDVAAAIPTKSISVNLPYSPNLTLLSVLRNMGGPTPYANAKESVVIRKKTGERISVDVDALWSTQDSTKDVTLESGDMVDVPLVTDVFVAGEVLVPGKFPYSPASIVSDYLTAAGGINPDTSNANCIYFVAKDGKKMKTTLVTNVSPGSVIVVQPNGFTKMTKTFDQISTVTAFVTVIIVFIAKIDTFWDLLVGIFPSLATIFTMGS